VIDPVAGRIRERSSYRVAHRMTQADGVVVVDTEVLDPSAAEVARSLARYRLELAEPVAALVLSRAME